MTTKAGGVSPSEAMMVMSHRGFRRALRVLGYFFVGFLWLFVLVRLLIRWGRFDSDLGELILYLPGVVLLLPILLMLLVSVAKRVVGLGIACFLAAIIVMGPVMEFRWATKKSSPDSFRVLTINAHSYSADLVVVSKSLRLLDPDILILQEVWLPEHLSAIEAEFPGYTFRGDRIWLGSNGVFVGSRLSSSKGIVPRPKFLASARVGLPNSDSLVVSVHGQKVHGFSRRAYQETRQIQLQQSQELVALKRESLVGLLVGGDFNAPAGGTFAGLEASGLKDAFSEGGRGYGYTFPSPLPVVRIDRLFFDPKNLVVLDCFTSTVGSDHLAVVADFRFK